MIKKTRQYKSELAVVGAGIAGCAATVFAQARGIQTTQIGNSGALAYTSGYFDLLGTNSSGYLNDPWAGLAQLRKDEPDHPYSKLTDQDLRGAFDEFITALNKMGISYSSPGENNHMAMLPAGACKPTFCMPETMFKGTGHRLCWFTGI